MGGKVRDEIRSETGNVTGMAADAPTPDNLGKRYLVDVEYSWESGDIFSS
jgi:hypothetical protein